jgi:transposase-like protein
MNWPYYFTEKAYQVVDEAFIGDYLTYIDYPVEVRRMGYTTNSIENLNRQIRKVIKHKVTFDKASNLLDLVFMVIKDFEEGNWQKYPVNAYQSWPRNTQFS